MSEIRIDWVHEAFEGGLETWRTEFRGMDVEIRKDPGVEHQVIATISAGDAELNRHAHPTHVEAMTNSLKWVNGYWDVLEDGPNVQYEAMDVSDLDSTAAENEEGS